MGTVYGSLSSAVLYPKGFRAKVLSPELRESPRELITFEVVKKVEREKGNERK